MGGIDASNRHSFRKVLISGKGRSSARSSYELSVETPTEIGNNPRWNPRMLILDLMDVRSSNSICNRLELSQVIEFCEN